MPESVVMSEAVRRAIRDATPADAAACAAIYAPYVRDTAISFEDEPPSEEAMAGRIRAAQLEHAWLVLPDPDRPGNLLGYAYAMPFATRPAYRWACEVSVYLRVGGGRRGGGRALYEALFARLSERGYRTAVAGITLPNDASEGLHRALGFDLVGTFRGIGWKHDAWWDVARYQRRLTDHPDPPRDPT